MSPAKTYESFASRPFQSGIPYLNPPEQPAPSAQEKRSRFERVRRITPSILQLRSDPHSNPLSSDKVLDEPEDRAHEEKEVVAQDGSRFLEPFSLNGRTPAQFLNPSRNSLSSSRPSMQSLQPYQNYTRHRTYSDVTSAGSVANFPFSPDEIGPGLDLPHRNLDASTSTLHLPDPLLSPPSRPVSSVSLSSQIPSQAPTSFGQILRNNSASPQQNHGNPARYRQRRLLEELQREQELDDKKRDAMRQDTRSRTTSTTSTTSVSTLSTEQSSRRSSTPASIRSSSSSGQQPNPATISQSPQSPNLPGHGDSIKEVVPSGTPNAAHKPNRQRMLQEIIRLQQEEERRLEELHAAKKQEQHSSGSSKASIASFSTAEEENPPRLPPRPIPPSELSSESSINLVPRIRPHVDTVPQSTKEQANEIRDRERLSLPEPSKHHISTVASVPDLRALNNTGENLNRWSLAPSLSQSISHAIPWFTGPIQPLSFPNPAEYQANNNDTPRSSTQLSFPDPAAYQFPTTTSIDEAPSRIPPPPPPPPKIPLSPHAEETKKVLPLLQLPNISQSSLHIPGEFGGWADYNQPETELLPSAEDPTIVAECISDDYATKLEDQGGLIPVAIEMMDEEEKEYMKKGGGRDKTRLIVGDEKRTVGGDKLADEKEKAEEEKEKVLRSGTIASLHGYYGSYRSI